MARRNVVLQRMAETGAISSEHARKTMEAPLDLKLQGRATYPMGLGPICRRLADARGRGAPGRVR